MAIVTKSSKNRSKPDSQLQLLKEFIKRKLKIKSMTYADLAREMKVSEVTVKRWLSSADLSFQVLIEMGKILDFQPFDQVADNFTDPRKFRFYNKAQEAFLVKNPVAFLIFIKLSFGFSIPEVLNQLGLKALQFRQHLKAMEKVKLLELWPEDEVKIKLRGPYRFPPGGLMARSFYPSLQKSLLRHFQDHYHGRQEEAQYPECRVFRPTETYLTRRSAHQLGRDLTEVFLRYANLSAMEVQNGEKVEPISVLIGVADFDLWADVLNR